MKLSPETKQKLIRYANAEQKLETEQRTIYFRDGSLLQAPLPSPILREWAEASDALKGCPESGIKKLVHAIQIERLDEVGEMSRIKDWDEETTKFERGKVLDASLLAKNELIALGHKFQGAVQPRQKRNFRIRRSR